MDLFNLARPFRQARPVRKQKRSGARRRSLLPSYAAVRFELSAAEVLAYVNMKCSLMFCDLAVGVAIPVYLEAMGLNIGMLRTPCQSSLLLNPRMKGRRTHEHALWLG